MYQFELTDPVCGYLLLELIKWYVKGKDKKNGLRSYSLDRFNKINCNRLEEGPSIRIIPHSCRSVVVLSKKRGGNFTRLFHSRAWSCPLLARCQKSF